MRVWSVVGAALFVAACAGSPDEASSPHFLLERGNAFYYEVFAPGSRKPCIYLLGSIHASDQPVSLGPELESDLARSDALVLELDPTALGEEEAGELMLRYGMLVPPERLEDQLSPETLALLRERTAQPDFTPVERQLVELLRPWAISMILLEKQLAAANAPAANGVDLAFANRAGRVGPILPLETPDEQLHALSSLSSEVAEAQLVMAISAAGADDFLDVQDIWRRGDEEALALLYTADPALAELHEVLIVARNARMADGLQELHEERPERVLFAVVGAAHLVGEASVPDLLREAGFRVERPR